MCKAPFHLLLIYVTNSASPRFSLIKDTLSKFYVIPIPLVCLCLIQLDFKSVTAKLKRHNNKQYAANSRHSFILTGKKSNYCLFLSAKSSISHYSTIRVPEPWMMSHFGCSIIDQARIPYNKVSHVTQGKKLGTSKKYPLPGQTK